MRGNFFQTNAEIPLKKGALAKLEWIDFLIQKYKHKPSACWFVDDTIRNYDVGLGLGILPSSHEAVNCFQDVDFKHNGTGLTKWGFDVIVESIEGELEDFDDEDE
jgi:hypothetical protein